MLLPTEKKIYTNYHFGIAGQFGDGGNAEVHYLQTSLRMKELESLKLLVDIPESEKWGVKDLFQRTIDRDRITGPGGLVPYFKDKSQVKYFNPITLVLLPTDDEIKFDRNVEKLKQMTDVKFENTTGISLSNEGVFRLIRQKPEDGNIGKVEWNSEKCYVVAIDGQHRLTALKELYEESKMKQELADIRNWQIPVVFLILTKKMQEGPNEKFVSLIRKIFMYINQKAEQVNDARAILLNDESIECLCVQEVIGVIHERDNPNENSKNTYPPLYLIDWVGAKTSVIAHTRYLFDNIELRAWMKHYLIGEDFSVDDRMNDNTIQFGRLDLVDLNLDFLLKGRSNLSYRDSEVIRRKFNNKIRDPFIQFLTSLTPIREYIDKCREFEQENTLDNTQMQVFSKLRYDYAKVENSYRGEYEEYLDNFSKTLFELKKETMSDFFRQDICLRGFVYAYSRIYDVYKGFLNKALPWDKYTDTFIESFNNLIEEGWCEGYVDLDSDKRELLTHICHDPTGKRINYKFNQVRQAWGIFILMHVLNDAAKKEIIPEEFKNDTWYNYKDSLQTSLERGFRDVVRAELAQVPLSEAEKKTRINVEKEERALARLEELETLWNLE